MSNSFFIGVGGTGSRCLESLVHFCAAGLGPERLGFGIVDQDQSNGNVARTRRLVDLYTRSRNYYRQPARNNLSRDHNFLKTEVYTPQGDAVWCPIPNTASSLRKVFNYSILKPQLRGVFDCLYSPDELDIYLDEGFRGKPHIGAAAILSNMNMGEGFWNSISSAINEARGGGELNIFLAGSIFGGMGASGFPTIVRKLRRILKDEGFSSGVKIGGALFLPYFSFPPPGSGDDTDVAYSEAFLEQTQGALNYYHNILEAQPDLFDALYVVGWDPLIVLDHHRKGGETQANPPMLPELYGCFAALDFFAGRSNGAGKMYHIGRNSDQELNWADFPPISDDPNETKTKLGNLLRFAFSFKHIYRPSLERNRFQGFADEAWFSRMITEREIDLNDDDIEAGLDLLESYCEDVLRWSASIIYSSSQPGQPIPNLFAPENYAFSDEDNPLAELELLTVLTPQNRKGFADLLVGQKSRPLHKVFEELSYAKLNSEHTGLSMLCGTLYDACRP